MSSSEKTAKNQRCRRFELLTVQEASCPLSVEDLAFKRAHLESCPSCRQQTELMDLLALDDTGEPAPPLDDLSRRRLLNRVLESVDQEEAQSEEEESEEEESGLPSLEDLPGTSKSKGPSPASKATSKKKRAKIFRISAVAASVVFLIAISSTLLLWRSSQKLDRLVAKRTVARPSGWVLLRAGQARMGRTYLAVGQQVTEPQTISVETGQAAIRLPLGSTILLSKKAVMVLESLDPRKTTIRLSRGEILASIAKRKTDQRFEVLTPHGRIVVTGTVFSIRVSQKTAELRVFEGAVDAFRAFHPAIIPVKSGQSLVFDPERRELGPKQIELEPSEKVNDRIRLLSLLSRFGSARIRIQTQPAGVVVMVDGTEVGKTPLEASILPGKRRLEIKLRGSTVVREYLELDPEDLIVRDLDLSVYKPLTAEKPTENAVKETTPLTTGAERRLSGRSSRSKPLEKAAVPAERPVAALGTAPEKISPQETPTPSAPVDTPQTLLDQAQKLRASRKFGLAAVAYRKLIKTFPASSESRAALVSLGLILLGPLKNPASALFWFQRYLSLGKNGLLAQEALHGKIRALRALKRDQEEIAAIRVFLARYPKALQAHRLRQRLKSLVGKASRPVKNPDDPVVIQPDKR